MRTATKIGLLNYALRVVSVLALLGRSEVALAQSSAWGERGWISGSVDLTRQPDGASDCPYLCGPLGGSGVGVMVGGGLWLTPRVAVVAEGTRAALVEGPQQVRVAAGYLDLATQHRDSVLGGGVAVALVRGRQGSSLDAVGLAGVARRRTERSGIRHFFTSSERPQYSDLLVDTVPAVGAGLDLRLRVAGNLVIAPSCRVHFILDDDAPDGQPAVRGVSRVLATAGVGLSVVF